MLPSSRTSEFVLRDYQSSAVDAALVWIKYKRGVNGYVVAPGGSGKSIMIAAVAGACADMKMRVLILARSEKLLRQNRAKINGPAGIYCAGLNEYDLSQQITLASIQSISGVNTHADIILVDECHEISPDSGDETQYWKFFESCGNPQIIGFTATAFRTTSGKIKWGEEIINIPIKPLIEAGYLVAPKNKVTNTPDLSNVKIVMGEYHQKQLAELYEDFTLLDASIKKIWQYSQGRHSILIFVQSIKHGEMLQNAMMDNDMESCFFVDGDTPKPALKTILERFEARQFRYLINCNLLTTGYDAPNIDMVAVIRSTVSKGLFEQMVYRGCRPYPGKDNFLLLDMGGNLEQHGPLGSPYQEKGSKERKTAPGRICPVCETYTNSIKDRECADCGFKFPESEIRKVGHGYDGDSHSETVYSGAIEEYEITGVRYLQHKSKAGNQTLRVDYLCAGTKYGAISEWFSPHHENEWARQKCAKFFSDRGHQLGSDTNSYSWDDLLWHCQHLKKPIRITVNHSEKFPRITKYEYEQSDRASHTASVSELLGDDFLPY